MNDRAVTLDLAVLREFVGDKPATLARFVAIGLDSLEQVLAPCLQEADPTCKQLREMAHRAKSTSFQLGAPDWAAACVALERAARDNDVAATSTHWNTVRRTWPALRQALLNQIAVFQADDNH